MNKDEKPEEKDKEMEDVRIFHGALMRELPEPRELLRRTPLYLKVFYVALLMWGVAFLVFWTISWSWDAYESGKIIPDSETPREVHQKPVEDMPAEMSPAVENGG
jgi:hypothetical protein